MNLLLLDPGELAAGPRVRLDGRRLRHAREVLRAEPGDDLRVGELGGRLGRGRVLAIDDSVLELEVRLDSEPPDPLPVDLVLALPRPPSLRRVLQQATALGVKRFALIHSARVEKSFWNSSALRPAALEEQLRLGLEQSRDTVLPSVETFRRFRPFVEDTLPEWSRGRRLRLAHPAPDGPPSPGETPEASGPSVLIVGPEGGFVPYEFERLCEAGARPLALGSRPLRVETAVVALLGALAASVERGRQSGAPTSDPRGSP
ncbi:MAG: 16S rRNA (uracil(1498)-N(3))-methyltransferase [Proteobacteria bacterium]|nr:16S rRNA (uracil(1498)-N(3))-methyltransferase [Pseudomonadota bacterium]